MLQRKMAIFVEGQTEQLFVERLLKEIAGYKNISITIYQIKGEKSNRKITEIKTGTLDSLFYVLLYDCGGDSSVVSDIGKQHISLHKNGYEKIVGLMDLYPKSLSEKTILEKSNRACLKSFLKISGISISIAVHLAVMEIEAWFLAEWNHFSKIDSSLTLEFIQQQLGFNADLDSMDERPHPSEDLDNIYKLIGKQYKKNLQEVELIIDNLDYEFLYLNLVNKIEKLKDFINEINIFLTSSN